MNLHHPVDALGIRPWAVLAAGFTAQDRVNPAIPVGRHVVDDRLDLFQQFLIGERRPPSGSGREFTRSVMLDRATPKVSHNAVIANRPSAASATGIF